LLEKRAEMKSKTLRSSAVLMFLSVILMALMIVAFLPQGASALPSSPSISGTVTRASDDMPVKDCTVMAVDSANVEEYATTTTDDDGKYTFQDMNYGSYFVLFFCDGYEPQIFDHASSPEEATPVVISWLSRNKTGIDASLVDSTASWTIEGCVTREDDGSPVEGCLVQGIDISNTAVIKSDYTDPTGHYKLEGLDGFIYKIKYDPSASDVNLAAEYYNDKPDFESANIVPVFSTGIDAELSTAKIESCTPESAAQGKTLDVTIVGSGTDFFQGSGADGSHAQFSGYGITVNSTTVKNPMMVVANITIEEGAATGPRDVNVITNSILGTENPKALKGGFTVKSGNYTAPGDPETWYLAEGTTAWGFDTYISVENPNDETVEIDVNYMTEQGAVPGGDYFLAPMSQGTLNPREILGDRDFSTSVTSTGGQPIAVDRTMSWNLPDGTVADGHCSVGVKEANRTWYLPEGSTNWGFETWLLIQNPNNTEATVEVTYMIEGEGPKNFEKKVPANTRQSYSMEKDIGNKDASIKVDSDIPVIPERAMYRHEKSEGHDSIGTTTPAGDYYLAEGATGYGPNFITYVLVQNPNDTANNVTVTYLTGTGEVAGPTVAMEPNSRKTIRVNEDLPPNTDVSTHVHGDSPIIAERAMYWDNGSGEACHDSIGMAQAHTTFYLPDGQTSDGRETWTLVSNPNDTEVQVEIGYLAAGGTGSRIISAVIPANSRQTFNMVDEGINGRASILVTCKTAGMKIMCERAMYWNDRGAGTDTIGGFSD
ncbi:MAG: carboxypeptidase regulatory-like domain-containing protein, partial [Actinobacteria bacterium]|nr:carboxypeptidase regulatory-like domain-containing protein [Actinomycetota bacterium]